MLHLPSNPLKDTVLAPPQQNATGLSSSLLQPPGMVGEVAPPPYFQSSVTKSSSNAAELPNFSPTLPPMNQFSSLPNPAPVMPSTSQATLFHSHPSLPESSSAVPVVSSTSPTKLHPASVLATQVNPPISPNSTSSSAPSVLTSNVNKTLCDYCGCSPDGKVNREFNQPDLYGIKPLDPSRIIPGNTVALSNQTRMMGHIWVSVSVCHM